MTTLLHENIGHYMAGLITLEELKNVAWENDTATIEELPNGKLLVEYRKTATKEVI